MHFTKYSMNCVVAVSDKLRNLKKKNGDWCLANLLHFHATRHWWQMQSLLFFYIGFSSFNLVCLSLRADSWPRTSKLCCDTVSYTQIEQIILHRTFVAKYAWENNGERKLVWKIYVLCRLKCEFVFGVKLQSFFKPHLIRNSIYTQKKTFKLTSTGVLLSLCCWCAFSWM